MKIKTAVKYKYKGAMKTVIIFFSILTVLLSALMFWFGSRNDGRSFVEFSGYGFGASILMFVVGISVIREDLRLYIQNGVGRKTGFLAEVIVAAFMAVALAVSGEIFVGIGHAASQYIERFFVMDLYQLTYAKEVSSLTFFQHIESAFLVSALLFATFACGMFFSLLFYRLSTTWRIVAGIAIPFTFLGLIPTVVLRFQSQTSALLNFAAASAWNLTLLLFCVSCTVFVIDWLLTRKIHIRGL